MKLYAAHGTTSEKANPYSPTSYQITFDLTAEECSALKTALQLALKSKETGRDRMRRRTIRRMREMLPNLIAGVDQARLAVLTQHRNDPQWPTCSECNLVVPLGIEAKTEAGKLPPGWREETSDNRYYCCVGASGTCQVVKIPKSQGPDPEIKPGERIWISNDMPGTIVHPECFEEHQRHYM